ESELVIYAADRMIEKEIDSIPIVRKKDNQKYEVIGRISKTTIAKLLVALYKE
ncbi:transcriptional repressor CcpN, partial [Staphylococcus aureus]|nr:transcriptional repressor CcpN [Staphylococcus aureus]